MSSVLAMRAASSIGRALPTDHQRAPATRSAATGSDGPSPRRTPRSPRAVISSATPQSSPWPWRRACRPCRRARPRSRPAGRSCCPGMTSGTSMLPPNGPGDSVVIASSCGRDRQRAHERLPRERDADVVVRQHPVARAARSQTRSGSGSCSVRVIAVEVRPPKYGISALTAKSRVGSIRWMRTASVSPGSAPST